LSAPLVDERAERFVLGSCLNAPELIRDLDNLEPSDFGVEHHAQLVQAILDVERRGHGVTDLSVAQLLKDRGQLAALGGPGGLMKIGNEGLVVGGGSFAEQVARIRSFAVRRRMVAAGQRAVLKAQDLTCNAEEAALESSGELSMVAARAGGARGGWRPMADVVHDELDRLQQIHEGPQEQVQEEMIETGIAPWDEALGGLTRGVVTFVVAKPGIGKTALTAAMGFSMSRRGTQSGILSLEDRSNVFARRLVSESTGLAIRDLIKRGRLSREQLDSLWGGVGGVAPSIANIMIDDERHVVAKRVVAKMKRLNAENGTFVFFVDHMMRMHDWSSEQQRDAAVQSIVVAMCDAAAEMNAAIVVNAHLRRDIQVNNYRDERYVRPKIQDIVGGVAVEQQARLIVGLWEIEPPKEPTLPKEREEPTPKPKATEEEKEALLAAHQKILAKERSAYEKKRRDWEAKVAHAQNCMMASVLKQNMGESNFDFELKRVKQAGLISPEKP